jgi:hypothetical protein
MASRSTGSSRSKLAAGDGDVDPQQTISKEALARLPELDIEELRQHWRGLFKAKAPPHLSRDLLARALAYRMQELALGGLRRSRRRDGAPTVLGRPILSTGRCAKRRSMSACAEPVSRTRQRGRTVCWRRPTLESTECDAKNRRPRARIEQPRYWKFVRLSAGGSGIRTSGPTFKEDSRTPSSPLRFLAPGCTGSDPYTLRERQLRTPGIPLLASQSNLARRAT